MEDEETSKKDRHNEQTYCVHGRSEERKIEQIHNKDGDEEDILEGVIGEAIDSSPATHHRQREVMTEIPRKLTKLEYFCPIPNCFKQKHNKKSFIKHLVRKHPNDDIADLLLEVETDNYPQSESGYSFTQKYLPCETSDYSFLSPLTSPYPSRQTLSWPPDYPIFTSTITSATPLTSLSRSLTNFPSLPSFTSTFNAKLNVPSMVPLDLTTISSTANNKSSSTTISNKSTSTAQEDCRSPNPLELVFSDSSNSPVTHSYTISQASESVGVPDLSTPAVFTSLSSSITTTPPSSTNRITPICSPQQGVFSNPRALNISSTTTPTSSKLTTLVLPSSSSSHTTFLSLSPSASNTTRALLLSPPRIFNSPKTFIPITSTTTNTSRSCFNNPLLTSISMKGYVPTPSFITRTLHYSNRRSFNNSKAYIPVSTTASIRSRALLVNNPNNKSRVYIPISQPVPTCPRFLNTPRNSNRSNSSATESTQIIASFPLPSVSSDTTRSSAPLSPTTNAIINTSSISSTTYTNTTVPIHGPSTGTPTSDRIFNPISSTTSTSVITTILTSPTYTVNPSQSENKMGQSMIDPPQAKTDSYSTYSELSPPTLIPVEPFQSTSSSSISLTPPSLSLPEFPAHLAELSKTPLDESEMFCIMLSHISPQQRYTLKQILLKVVEYVTRGDVDPEATLNEMSKKH